MRSQGGRWLSDTAEPAVTDAVWELRLRYQLRVPASEAGGDSAAFESTVAAASRKMKELGVVESAESRLFAAALGRGLQVAANTTGGGGGVAHLLALAVEDGKGVVMQGALQPVLAEAPAQGSPVEEEIVDDGSATLAALAGAGVSAALFVGLGLALWRWRWRLLGVKFAPQGSLVRVSPFMDGEADLSGSDAAAPRASASEVLRASARSTWRAWRAPAALPLPPVPLDLPGMPSEAVETEVGAHEAAQAAAEAEAEAAVEAEASSSTRCHAVIVQPWRQPRGNPASGTRRLLDRSMLPSSALEAGAGWSSGWTAVWSDAMLDPDLH